MKPESIARPFARRALRVLCASAALGLVSMTATASAQDGESTAQKPFIMILMDTSGSMEWTDEGDEEYPKDASGQSWSTDEPFYDDSGDLVEQYYGPCRVWNPDSCGQDYYRPTWNWRNNGEWLENEEQDAESDIRRSYTDTNLPPYRLSNRSQPRHVTLKEILTGDMLLAPDDYDGLTQNLDAEDYGPGCWVVPRQRGSSINGSICPSGHGSQDGSKGFEKFPDHTDPQPHFQEVFDEQHPNGLMDTMSRSAIFGLAMFDSYAHSKDQPNGDSALAEDWEAGNYSAEHINNSAADDYFAGLREGEGGPNIPSDDKDNYNLGVYQMIAPETFDVGADIASDISTFVQYALVDAGYLSTDDRHSLKISKHHDEGDNGGQSGDEIVFSKSLDQIMDDYDLGKQPVARATPLSAAIYDIHQYFAEGSDQNDSPITKDRYLECRPKQVIMLTDGKPEPERAGGLADLESDTLNSAFGYNKPQYPYSYTEQAIDFFVRDQEYQPNFNSTTGETTFGSAPRSTSEPYLVGSWNGSSGSEDYRKALNYNPRVHIVGLTGQKDANSTGPPGDTPLEERVIQKMAEMAIAGRTCAGYYLKEAFIPDSDGGNCDETTDVCLDARQAAYMDGRTTPYTYLARDGGEDECRYPALILSFPEQNPTGGPNDNANLVKRTAEGLQLLFNHIVSSGLSSRTRPTFVNRLDDASKSQGGQYRYFSGVKVEAGEVFWKGQLFRETDLCPDSSGETVDFAEQISDLAGEVEWNGDTPSVVTPDKRRIFTSFSSWNPLYYTAASSPGYTSGTRFSFGVDLVSLANNGDVFKDGYLWYPPSGLENTRVSLDADDFADIWGTIESSNPSITKDSYFKYLQTQTDAEAKFLIDEVRGRTDKKQGRALGAILNASPVAVEPPARALPIESYRQFQSQYANRPSMLYVATTDGLLHALYAGGPKTNSNPADQDKVTLSDGTIGSKSEQREAWAYLPQMLHHRLAGLTGQHAYLLDGTPTVQDVRLCQSQSSDASKFNLNTQACANATDPDDFNPAFQWRTVLVGGLGSAGEGYFAMDITRPGGQAIDKDGSFQTEAPDPIPLWEFDPTWEQYQVAKIASDVEPDLVYPPSVPSLPNDVKSDCDNISGGSDAEDKFWSKSFMGNSVGEAAIGTVIVDADFGQNPDRLRRPIAMLSGGATTENIDDCRKHRMGRAIYIVDLQTGSLLRRFVSYENDAGDDVRFEHPITGSPALYDSRPGSLVTRGFVGDAHGRLLRVDLSDADPANWYVKVLFDPHDISGYENADFGPAAFKPALAKSTSGLANDLLIFYGLGERGDLSTSGTKQLMIAVQETIEASTNGINNFRVDVTGTKLWHHEFDNADNGGDYSEKLTGAPVVFNSGVYFTSYVEPAGEYCRPGWSRIFGMTFQGTFDPINPNTDADPKGLFRPFSVSLDDGQANIPDGTACVKRNPGDSICIAYEPEDPEDLEAAIVVRGLTITQGKTCAPPITSDQLDPGRDTSDSDPQPTLVAQSTSSKFSAGGSAVDGSASGNNGGNGGDDGIFAIEQKLAKTTTGNNPLSWSVIDN